jgi:hypothetical protein
MTRRLSIMIALVLPVLFTCGSTTEVMPTWENENRGPRIGIQWTAHSPPPSRSRAQISLCSFPKERRLNASSFLRRRGS